MNQEQSNPGQDRSAAIRRRSLTALKVAAQFLLPLVLFYGLRAAGVSVYATLLAGAAAAVAGSVVGLIRDRTTGQPLLYVVTIMVFSTGVSLLSGDERFLLARGAWVAGLSGLWLLSGVFARKPLVYVYSRPLLEGRFGWPADWDRLWERIPRFRRIWRVSSVIIGTGLTLDAGLRVLMAYTLPVDSVPALSSVLSAVTLVAVLAAVNVYYQVTGAARKWSRFYAGAGAGPRGAF